MASFDVERDENVIFQQPSQQAIILNDIQDADPSKILGQIDANGTVILSNVNGLLFGETAQVNAQNIIATNMQLQSQLDSSALRWQQAQQAGAVINHGKIQVNSGGSVSLMADQVENHGFIVADYGQVNLASGRQVVMDFDGDELIQFEVSTESVNQLATAKVLNNGHIQSNGGKVVLQAAAAQEIVTSVVNNAGLIEAQHINQHGGEIHLLANHGQVGNSGQLNVNAASKLDHAGALVVTGEQVFLKMERNYRLLRKCRLAKFDWWGFQGNRCSKCENTVIEQDVNIAANGLQTGDAGR